MASENATTVNTGTAALFTPIYHPTLASLDPSEVIKFMDKRANYELQVQEKQKEIPSLTAASYRVSLDPQLLRSMHFMGEFDSVAPNEELKDITSGHIEDYLKGIVENAQSKLPDTPLIEIALMGLKTPMNIADASARIKQLVADYLQRMADIGYSGFKDSNPKMTVTHLTNVLHPPQLKAQIEKDLEYRPSLKTNVREFIKHVAIQAEHIEKSESFSKSLTRHHQTPGTETPVNPTESLKKSGDRKKPVCLFPPHEEKGFRHYLSDCKDCPEEQKKNLLDDHKAKKMKRKKEGNARAVAKHPKRSDNYFIVDAVFADVADSAVCVDSGSDVKLFDEKLLNELRARGAVMEVTSLEPTLRFGLAVISNEEGNDVHVECTYTVKLSIKLSIRHGAGLVLRNTLWYVTNSKMNVPLLGRHILKALGLDPENMLRSTFEKHGGIVDIDDYIPNQNLEKGTIAYVMNQGVFHAGSNGVDEGSDNLEEEYFVDLGEDSSAELETAVLKMLKNAKENGMSDRSHEKLSELIHEYKAIFRIRLGNDAPAQVEPMRVQLENDHRPVIASTRRYSEDQRKFLDAYVDRLIEFRFTEEEKNPTWAAAPLLISKPASAKFRLTLDLRPINSANIPMAWPMPHKDSELLDLAGTKCVSSIDFVSGYWQLPLDAESQTYHSFITPRAVFRPTRSLQGAKNSASSFQSRVEPCSAEIRQNLKAWLDDFLIHAKTEDELIECLRKFFRVCGFRNLKLLVLKTVPFVLRVKWCGRIIDSQGFRFDPRRLSGLLKVSMPMTAGELSQFIYCAQWMSSSIPDFTRRITPLRDVLEESYKKSGKRTTKSVANMHLSQFSCGALHEKCYTEINESLKSATVLSHRDIPTAICIYTDASDKHWAAVIAQCPTDQLKELTMEQNLAPLPFLSGQFKDSMSRWTNFENEAYAIYEVFRKSDYMLISEQSIHLYTDHRNLLFLFNPHVREPPLGRHIISKVERWVLYLPKFQYVIEHLDGDCNIMADIMTRWMRGYRGHRVARRITALLNNTDIFSSPTDDDFIWPSLSEIREVQQKSEETRDANRDENGMAIRNGKIWIPTNDHNLQYRLPVIAHAGSKGHRGTDATLDMLRENFYWTSMNDDCREFVTCCIHCLVSMAGDKVPRPLATTTHASSPNEILHFDFIYMGTASGGNKYLLVLKDDLSGYVCLEPCASGESSTVTDSIRKWISTITTMDFWVSRISF